MSSIFDLFQHFATVSCVTVSGCTSSAAGATPPTTPTAVVESSVATSKTIVTTENHNRFGRIRRGGSATTTTTTPTTPTTVVTAPPTTTLVPPTTTTTPVSSTTSTSSTSTTTATSTNMAGKNSTATPVTSVSTGGSTTVTASAPTSKTSTTVTATTPATPTSTNAVATNGAPTVAAASTSFFIYQNDDGTGLSGMNALWYYDMSYGSGAANYRDTTHPQSGHQFDLQIPAGLAWQVGSAFNSGHPAASGIGPFGFDLAPYTWLTFDIWSASPTETFDMEFEYLGNSQGGTADQPAAAYVDNVLTVPGSLKQYANGGWTYQVRIPLAMLGHLGNHSVYKFYLRDNSNNAGGASQTFYLDNVGYDPGVYSFIYDGGAVSGWNSSTMTWNWDASEPINGWSDASVNASANYAYNPAGLSSILNHPNSLNGLKTPGYGTTVTSTNAIELSVTSAGGMWKATNAAGFALGQYSYFTFGALPTNASHSYKVQLYDTTGKAVGNAVDPSAYTNHDWGAHGGYWTVYAIPLTAFGTVPSTIGSVSIQDTSGAASNTIYLSAPGFFD